jgi:hypothetical protein
VTFLGGWVGLGWLVRCCVCVGHMSCVSLSHPTELGRVRPSPVSCVYECLSRLLFSATKPASHLASPSSLEKIH